MQTSQHGVQMQGLTGYDKEFFGEGRSAFFPNLDIVCARPQPHRPVFMSGSGIRAIDEHLRVSYLRV